MRLTLVVVVFFVSCSFAQQSTLDISHAIRLFFKYEPALHCYFCHRDDALRLATLAKRERLTVNARTIPSSAQVFQDISAGKETVQRLGVFLDARCPEGVAAVLECAKMFNATFTWLIWTDDVLTILRDLEASRVSADSRVALALWEPDWDQPLLMDVYRTHVNSSFRITNVSTTTWMNGVTSWYHCRMNLSGHKFKASTVLFEFPFRGREDEDRFMDPNYKAFTAGFRRYGYAILYLLSRYYSFDFEVRVYDKWHTIYPNGTPTGMLKDLILGASDFGVAPSKYIPERLEFASFLGVLGSVRFLFVFRQPSASGSVSALVAPMSPGAWTSLLCVCLLCGVVLWLVLIKDKGIAEPYKWNESFFITLSTVSQQGIGEIGGKISTQIVLLTVFIMAYIANTLYNTSVLNGLLIKAPDAIQNPDQLIRSDLKIICNDVGYLRDQMEFTDSLTKRFKEKMIKNDRPFYKLEEGIKLVKSGPFALYVVDDDFYRAAGQMQTSEEICSTSNLQKERSFPTGIFGVKDSPYREHFRKGIFYLQETGIIPQLTRMYRANKPDCTWTLEADSFGLKPLSLAYIVFSSGFLTSLIIFAGEWVRSKLLCRISSQSLISKEQGNDYHIGHLSLNG